LYKKSGAEKPRIFLFFMELFFSFGFLTGEGGYAFKNLKEELR